MTLLSELISYKLPYTFIFIALLISCDVFSSKQYTYEKETPLEYNDFMVKNIDTVSAKFIEFLEAFNQSYSAGVMDEIRLEIKSTAKESLSNINELKPFSEDNDFRAKAIKVVDYYAFMANEYLVRVVEILRKEETGDITEADYEQAFEILYETEVKEFEVLLEFDEAQSDFMNNQLHIR